MLAVEKHAATPLAPVRVFVPRFSPLFVP